MNLGLSSLIGKSKFIKFEYKNIGYLSDNPINLLLNGPLPWTSNLFLECTVRGNGSC